MRHVCQNLKLQLFSYFADLVFTKRSECSFLWICHFHYRLRKSVTHVLLEQSVVFKARVQLEVVRNLSQAKVSNPRDHCIVVRRGSRDSRGSRGSRGSRDTRGSHAPWHSIFYMHQRAHTTLLFRIHSVHVHAEQRVIFHVVPQKVGNVAPQHDRRSLATVKEMARDEAFHHPCIAAVCYL